MRARSRTLLKDRRGISSTATAALFSIVVILIFMSYMKAPGRTKEIAYAFFDFFKAAKVLPPNFDPSGILESPVGELAAYITSMMSMVLIVTVTFCGIKYPMEIATTILAWRGEKQQKIHEQNEREYRLWRERFAAEDEEPSALLPKLSKIMEDKPVTMIYGGSKSKASRENIPSITHTGGLDHQKCEDWGVIWLIDHGETYIEDHTLKAGWDEERRYRRFKCLPDLTTESYVLDAKTGRERDRQTERDKAKKLMWLAKQQKKGLVYLFWNTPEEDHWWYDIIGELKSKLGDRFIHEFRGVQ